MQWMAPLQDVMSKLLKVAEPLLGAGASCRQIAKKLAVVVSCRMIHFQLSSFTLHCKSLVLVHSLCILACALVGDLCSQALGQSITNVPC